MTAIESLLRQPAAQAIAWALGLLTAAALLALRRSAADVRYVVGVIGLSLMLTMPAVTAFQAWKAIPDSSAAAVASTKSSDDIHSGGATSTVAPVSSMRADRLSSTRSIVLFASTSTNGLPRVPTRE